jgi:N-acetylglucosamine kinase-like BadF-type ATPase
MKLIIESGSTKSNWLSYDQNSIIETKHAIGLNPYFVESKTIIDTIESLNYKLNSFTHIYFYGAGCAQEEPKQKIKEAFSKLFINAYIEVEGDLLAAARALYAKQAGVVGILGTGSNTAFYNGNIFTDHITSLGYVLGDEGSGNHIGRSLVRSYFNKKMPNEIATHFTNEFNINAASVLNKIYKEPYPNRFLASLAIFASSNKENSFINNMLKQCFREYFENQVQTLDLKGNRKIGFVGSIAFYFQDVIKDVAQEFDFEIEKIIKDPLEELAQFHK